MIRTVECEHFPVPTGPGGVIGNEQQSFFLEVRMNRTSYQRQARYARSNSGFSYRTGSTSDGRKSTRDVGTFGRNILRSRGAGGSGG